MTTTTIPQLLELQKRLGQLEIQKARYGINAEPSIVIEAQTLDVVIAAMKLIDTHRRNVQLYLGQVGHFGASAPVYVRTSLVNEREQIAQQKAICRSRGYIVSDLEIDFDQPAIRVEEPEVSSNPLPMSLIQRARRRISYALELLDEGEINRAKQALEQLLETLPER